MNQRFLDPTYCREYAKANRDEILANRKAVEEEYARFLNEDEEIRWYCQTYDPTIGQVVVARFHLIELAEQEQVKAASPPKSSITPTTYRDRQMQWSQMQAEDEIAKIEHAIMQAVERHARLDQLKQQLIQQHPARAALIEDIFVQFEQSAILTSVHAGTQDTKTEVGEEPPAPEIYGTSTFPPPATSPPWPPPHLTERKDKP